MSLKPIDCNLCLCQCLSFVKKLKNTASAQLWDYLIYWPLTSHFSIMIHLIIACCKTHWFTVSDVQVLLFLTFDLIIDIPLNIPFLLVQLNFNFDCYHFINFIQEQEASWSWYNRYHYNTEEWRIQSLHISLSLSLPLSPSFFLSLSFSFLSHSLFLSLSLSISLSLLLSLSLSLSLFHYPSFPLPLSFSFSTFLKFPDSQSLNQKIFKIQSWALSVFFNF